MLGFSVSKKLVVYVAGSLGSSSLNQKMLDFLNSNLHDSYEILYIVGSNINVDEFKKKITNLKGIKIVPYFDNLPGIMAASDLVISRAGAGTLFEIIGLEKPSIIIPSPNVANNHQYYNAKELETKGIIKMLEEKDLTKELLSENINNYLNNQEQISQMKKNMVEYKKVSPSETIYKTIKELMITKK